MGCIKSKFKGDAIFLFVFMSLWLIPGVIMISRAIASLANVFIFTHSLFTLFFIALFFFGLNFLKHIRRINVNDNTLKYHSLLRPFGKTLNLDNYTGKIILEETGSAGSYKVLYLVDKESKTSFKIMGLHYKNFDEINDAIPLKVIRFTPTLSQYFKLLFFEKIIITNKNSSSNHLIAVFLTAFKIIALLGIVLFILVSLVRGVNALL